MRFINRKHILNLSAHSDSVSSAANVNGKIILNEIVHHLNHWLIECLSPLHVLETRSILFFVSPDIILEFFDSESLENLRHKVGMAVFKVFRKIPGFHRLPQIIGKSNLLFRRSVLVILIVQDSLSIQNPVKINRVGLTEKSAVQIKHGDSVLNRNKISRALFGDSVDISRESHLCWSIILPQRKRIRILCIDRGPAARNKSNT